MPKKIKSLIIFEEDDLYELRVSSQGHVVLPEELRVALGIEIGDRLFLTLKQGLLILLRRAEARRVVGDGLKFELSPGATPG